MDREKFLIERQDIQNRLEARRCQIVQRRRDPKQSSVGQTLRPLVTWVFSQMQDNAVPKLFSGLLTGTAGWMISKWLPRSLSRFRL
jgi:hypothetical protein